MQESRLLLKGHTPARAHLGEAVQPSSHLTAPLEDLRKLTNLAAAAETADALWCSKFVNGSAAAT
jgi:hypothetical protein